MSCDRLACGIRLGPDRHHIAFGRSHVLLRTHDVRQIRRAVLGRWRHQGWRATGFIVCKAHSEYQPRFRTALWSKFHQHPTAHRPKVRGRGLALTREGHAAGGCRFAPSSFHLLCGLVCWQRSRDEPSGSGSKKEKWTQFVLFSILPKPCAQTPASNHLLANLERGCQTRQSGCIVPLSYFQNRYRFGAGKSPRNLEFFPSVVHVAVWRTAPLSRYLQTT